MALVPVVHGGRSRPALRGGSAARHAGSGPATAPACGSTRTAACARRSLHRSRHRRQRSLTPLAREVDPLCTCAAVCKHARPATPECVPDGILMRRPGAGSCGGSRLWVFGEECCGNVTGVKRCPPHAPSGSALSRLPGRRLPSHRASQCPLLVARSKARVSSRNRTPESVSPRTSESASEIEWLSGCSILVQELISPGSPSGRFPTGDP